MIWIVYIMITILLWECRIFFGQRVNEWRYQIPDPFTIEYSAIGLMKFQIQVHVCVSSTRGISWSNSCQNEFCCISFLMDFNFILDELYVSCLYKLLSMLDLQQITLNCCKFRRVLGIEGYIQGLFFLVFIHLFMSCQYCTLS